MSGKVSAEPLEGRTIRFDRPRRGSIDAQTGQHGGFENKGWAYISGPQDGTVRKG